MTVLTQKPKKVVLFTDVNDGAATPSSPGLMSAADKATLDSLTPLAADSLPSQIAESLYSVGTDLIDGDSLIQPFLDGASDYAMRDGVRSTNRTITLGVSSAFTGAMVAIRDYETSSKTLTVLNGGPAGRILAVFPASHTSPIAAWFYYDGTDWVFESFVFLNPGA